MNAGELCVKSVVQVDASCELITAAKLMREHHVGCVVVVSPNPATGGRKPVGILTDRDIVTSVIAREVEPQRVRVDDLMTRKPVTVSEDTSLAEALQRMRAIGVRRLPVVKDNGDLSGILTLDDVVGHLVGQLGAVAASITHEQRAERSLRP